MNTEKKTLLISFLLHAVVIGSAASFAGGPAAETEPEPILIDFTVKDSELAGKTEISKAGGKKAGAAHAVPQSSIKADSQPLPNQSHPKPEATAENRPVPSAETISPLQPKPSATSANTQAGKVSGQSTSGDNGSSGKGTGSDKGPENAESLQANYLKKHFSYIRDLIASNLRYPALAQRMGWSGRVTVEFVVKTNGTVESVRIAKSSRIPILDNDARDTVIKSAPFPKPPISARIVIPVDYSLE